MYSRSYALPWELVAEENRRFRRILSWTLGITLVLSIVLAALPLPDRASLTPPELPKRMAKLLLEPKPVPKQEEVKLPPKPEKPVERKVEVKLPKPKAPVVETVRPDPEPQPDARVAARERAASAGVMAFADQLADLRDATPGDSLSTDTQVAATGSGTAQRALVTTAKGTASAGINTSAMSRATGGGGLAERQTTRVTTQQPTRTARASNQRKGSDSGVGGRSREEIEQVFDKNKAAIYALYRRALRSDPTLEGKVVLTLTIAPSGAVTEVQIVSSELAAPELEAKLLRRIRLFDFGARDVAVTTTTKPIDFFPA
ncbi:MAG: AgmX/PglI C-terminal domain-containing protein [Gammaproteobacteria bacterium]|nr:AgmX/PglI C-terminal domain-containing protein [Gammaproteobacteria bacterium]